MEKGVRADTYRNERTTESIESLRKLIGDGFSHSPIRNGSSSRAHFEFSKLKESFKGGKTNFMEKVDLAKKKIVSTIDDLRVIKSMERNL